MKGVKDTRLRQIAFDAFRQGNLEGGDPAENGKVPDEIEQSIRNSFDVWWLDQNLEPLAKLSHSQRRMLKNIWHYADPWRGVHGQSEHGGAHGTFMSLIRLGLITYEYNSEEGEYVLVMTRLGKYNLTCSMCRNVHPDGGPITGCVLR